jgi:hypothetical protein
MRAYRLSLAYAWEKEAFKLQPGEANAKRRQAVEGFLLGHLRAAAPPKYQKQLTPNYPVSLSAHYLAD